MKIEIWSDIMCPFCYIGKRHLEAALAQFPDVPVELEWKSFQLDPHIVSQADKDVYTYLAERKGMSVEASKRMHEGVVERAAAVGLDYRFDKAVIANSLQAHRIIQLAKKNGLGDQLEEFFFRAYFTDGENLADRATLKRLGILAGLLESDIQKTLDQQLFSEEIEADLSEARHIGIQGVPFFVFDRKYAVSGAQPIETFVETIQAVVKK
jgi:predicted DsbA family dithiol-disulfide isomerase